MSKDDDEIFEIDTEPTEDELTEIELEEAGIELSLDDE